MPKATPSTVEKKSGSSASPEVSKDLSLSILKASLVLRIVGDHQDGCTLTEVAKASKLGTTVCHRILATLEHERLLDKDAATGRFRLGLGMLSMAYKVQSTHPLSRAAAPLVTEVVNRTQDIALLMVRDGDEVICIERKEGPFPVRASGTRIGTRLPMYCGGAPLAMLAFLSDEFIDRYLATYPMEKRTERTVTDPRQIRKEIERVRRRGYTVGNQDLFDYVVAIGVPIFAPDGTLLGSLSIGGVEQRYTPKRIKEVGEWLAAASLKAFPYH